MDDRTRRRRQREALEKAQEEAKELGRAYQLEGLDDLLVPNYPGRIRRDPMMVQMYDVEKLAEALGRLNVRRKELEAQGALDVQEAEVSPVSLRDVDGIGADLVEKLEEAGIYSVEDLRGANDEDLLKVSGIGKASLKRIRRQVG